MLFRVESFLNGKKIQIASPKEPFSKNQLFHLFPKAFKYQSAAAWLATWLDHFEIDVVWTVFKEFLKLHTHISVFWGFWWISGISEFSILGIGHKTKTRKSRKIFIFWFIALQCMWICVLTTFLTVWVKTDINKNGLNSIYSEGLKAFKTQLAVAWLAMWLNHCNFDVIWTIFLEFLKLCTHISVFWGFWWVSVISEFSFLGIGLKTKTQKLRKIIINGF